MNPVSTEADKFDSIRPIRGHGNREDSFLIQSLVGEMESGANDPSELARGRLAVLSAHLAADLSSFGLTPALERSPALSVEASRPSGNLGGSMTVIDERTVYKYVLQVSPEGTVKAPDFKKVGNFFLFFLRF
ncbi:hypothetical protein GW17_00033920 [Ensete ventricosum]|nr:hypothetical protein GW17_00033920 [Ensete ventricosum]RZS00131.1 hypothetical protein BHM03_00029785 [Ensete ventricosum]